MSYKVRYTKTAMKQLKKLDKPTAKLLTEWIKRNLDGIEEPRRIGKPLTDNKSNQWRYRKGNYRIIVDIQDEEIIILVLAIGHRRDIYRK
ncbi:type II toxin-antitoxin system RelE/ParE family toxin [Staphylococcus sp. Marseille-Q5304]|uniref:type II toxin-antitoxin system RelE family toxin n=1 Tax=Staphylococcus sp. Marseille-Q5304 TaxID=2942200 RepID=UPI0020741D05|nr:type II toxin-antitoxin system RelE/ParE family toxin [Staphylococcus sp. Marseille-Q5304]